MLFRSGENDHVVIGTVNFEQIKKFQLNYYEEFAAELQIIREQRTKKKPVYPKKDKAKPNIKPLSARFKL